MLYIVETRKLTPRFYNSSRTEMTVQSFVRADFEPRSQGIARSVTSRIAS